MEGWAPLLQLDLTWQLMVTQRRLQICHTIDWWSFRRHYASTGIWNRCDLHTTVYARCPSRCNCWNRSHISTSGLHLHYCHLSILGCY